MNCIFCVPTWTRAACFPSASDWTKYYHIMWKADIRSPHVRTKPSKKIIIEYLSGWNQHERRPKAVVTPSKLRWSFGTTPKHLPALLFVNRGRCGPLSVSRNTFAGASNEGQSWRVGRLYLIINRGSVQGTQSDESAVCQAKLSPSITPLLLLV